MTGLVTWLVYLVHSGAGLRIMGFLIVLQCYFQEMSSKTLCADSHCNPSSFTVQTPRIAPGARLCSKARDARVRQICGPIRRNVN